MTARGNEIEPVPTEPVTIVADGVTLDRARVRMIAQLIQRADKAFAATEEAMDEGDARSAQGYATTGGILLDKARQLAGDPAPRRDLSAMSRDEQAARLAELLERARQRDG